MEKKGKTRELLYSLERIFPRFFTFSFLSQSNNPYEWLQVDFEVVKRITGIVTQGAKSVFTSLMVTEFSISVSDDGHSWVMVTDPRTKQEKVCVNEESFTKDSSRAGHLMMHF